MLLRPFEAAVSQPQSDTPNTQLCTLVSAADHSGSEFPTIAENHLFDQTRPQAPPEDKNGTTTTSSSSSTSMLSTSGKGKPARVSRAAKQKALQQFGPRSHDKNTCSKTGEKGGHARETPIAAWSMKRRSHRSDVVPDKKVTNNTNTRKAHVKHKVDDDEDYVPSRIESRKNQQKKQSSAKRKAVGGTKEDEKQTKKPRLQANNPEGPIDCATKRRHQSKSFITPASSVVSSRHLLIAGLKASQKPIEASHPTFKKPMLPSHVTQAPLTPTKPKKKLVETQKRSHTPRGARRPLLDDVFSQMPSSPPIPYEADEMDDWSQNIPAVAAILSSNSKPIPASPNAESTAISGHAYCDDVAHDKWTGDSQTAQSDPFTRRTRSRKATSFLRRLTEDESTAGDSDPATETLQGVLPEVAQDSPARRVVDLDPGNQGSTLDGECCHDQQRTSEAEILPVYLDSSPPRMHPPSSSHSSTSAEYLFSSEPPLPWSEAEEIGWEKSPDPHQCSLHDALISTSKRVVRHIIDSETGLDEVAEAFATDGEYILKSLLSRHGDDYKHVFADMERKRDALRAELEYAIKRMAGERKRIGF